MRTSSGLSRCQVIESSAAAGVPRPTPGPMAAHGLSQSSTRLPSGSFSSHRSLTRTPPPIRELLPSRRFQRGRSPAELQTSFLGRRLRRGPQRLAGGGSTTLIGAGNRPSGCPRSLIQARLLRRHGRGGGGGFDSSGSQSMSSFGSSCGSCSFERLLTSDLSLNCQQKTFLSQRRKQSAAASGLAPSPQKDDCWRALCLLPPPRAFLQTIVDLPADGPVRDALFASVGALVAFTMSGVMAWMMQRNDRRVKAAAEERGPASIPEVPNPVPPPGSPPGSITQGMMGGAVSGQKESVEWVNMVLHKIWKVYRRSLEAWLVGLLQPAIDSLSLPSVVRRVEIAEFSLDYEPLSVRNVQRRASRRANDLQYHVGLRYTGDARCLLLLHLTVAGVDFAVPVGVHNLDVDAELWVKLRLTPRKPYVGTLSIAFVRLPTIKLVLAPFRIVNLFAIPFLSSFLSKLLTVDLPRLLVLPRHITFDFLPAGEDVSQHLSPSAMVLDLLKSETFQGLAGQEPASASQRGPTRMEPSDAFVGELSVTLCEARNLPTLGFSVFSNPYCRLMVGEAMVESKKNSETSHPAGARDPVWNQDFLFWVEDPVQQKLTVIVRDSMAPLSRSIGFVQIPIWQLQDCVPLSMWLPLLQDGPFGVQQASQGEIRLLLTYKSYVDLREGDDATGLVPGSMPASPASASAVAYIKVFGSDVDEASGSEGEGDSDGERERQELQRERAEKGLDKLGEEPGVEVVATNEGQLARTAVPLDAAAGAAGPVVADRVVMPVSGGEAAVGTSKPSAKASKPMQHAGVVEADSEEDLGDALWKGTQAVVSKAGSFLGGTGKFLWAAGGVAAAGAGGVVAGTGDLAKALLDRVAPGVGFGGEGYIYEDEEEDYSVDAVRVRSYKEETAEGQRSREGESVGEAADLEEEMVMREGLGGASGRSEDVGSMQAESWDSDRRKMGGGNAGLSTEKQIGCSHENVSSSSTDSADQCFELEEDEDHEKEEEGRTQDEASASRTRGFDDLDFYDSDDGRLRWPDGPSLEQQVARMVEWNLDGRSAEELMQAFSAPRFSDHDEESEGEDEEEEAPATGATRKGGLSSSNSRRGSWGSGAPEAAATPGNPTTQDTETGAVADVEEASRVAGSMAPPSPRLPPSLDVKKQAEAVAGADVRAEEGAGRAKGSWGSLGRAVNGLREFFGK